MQCSDLKWRVNQSARSSHTITVAERCILKSLYPFIYTPLHLYFPRNSFTYLLNSQSATLSLNRDAREEMSAYYLECKQTVKDDCQETAHPRCLKATAVCCYKMPAGDGVHIGLWFSDFGKHQSHLEASFKHRLQGPPPESLIQQVQGCCCC